MVEAESIMQRNVKKQHCRQVEVAWLPYGISQIQLHSFSDDLCERDCQNGQEGRFARRRPYFSVGKNRVQAYEKHKNEFIISESAAKRRVRLPNRDNDLRTNWY